MAFFSYIGLGLQGVSMTLSKTFSQSKNVNEYGNSSIKSQAYKLVR